MNKTGSSGSFYKGLYRLGFQNVAVGRINGVAGLTGFSYKNMTWPFRRDKKK